eukprot:comp24220_c0_seq1/m.44577 comp24220_c0_seq1/g.44577  ORF comp24220_c0_seq1/g.44577 comp24220_c0_seq1/m.44577 type:complete len:705 (-) comp24220_c0_seq1:209-2323(-)
MGCDEIGEGNVTLAFVLTAVAGLSINIGALVPFLPGVRRGRMSPLAAGLAFAAGVLVFIGLTEVFKDAVEFFSCDLENELHAYYATVGCMVGGILMTAGLEVMVHAVKDRSPNARRRTAAAPSAAEVEAGTSSVMQGKAGLDSPVDEFGMTESDKSNLKEMSLLTTIALCIHNFPEGLATFAAVLASSKMGIALAVALILHNIPEGIGIALPIYYATGSKWRALPYTFVIGAMLPISAGIAYAAFRNSMSGILYGVLMGMASGMIMFISVHELLPAAFKYSKRKNVITSFFILGMVVMSVGIGIGEGMEGDSEANALGLTGKVREYYIAAVEQEWDYAPSGRNQLHDVPLDEDDNAKTFATNADGFIGRKYKKVLYRAYKDESFQEPLPHPDHLGFLGPFIRAEVGDTIKVVFRNMASREYSMHPHGVMYTKDNEGAMYMDGSNGMGGEPAVAPNSTYEYEWFVPEDAGPADRDATSILWGYHSHIHEVQDVYSGLVGPMIIYRAGMLNKEGIPERDIDQEYVAFLNVDDENQSWYLDDNIATYANSTRNKTSEGGKFTITNAKINSTLFTVENVTMEGNVTLTPNEDKDFEEAFTESNLMHNINGYVYGNLRFEMCKGQRVRWYVMAMGNEVDLHTAHWHGQTLTMDGRRVDTVELLPATFRTLDMVPRKEGAWLFHCHVNDHIAAGMAVLAHVGPEGTCQRV